MECGIRIQRPQTSGILRLTAWKRDWRLHQHGITGGNPAEALAQGCPQHKCNRIVPTSFFGRFCDEERQKKYQEPGFTRDSEAEKILVQTVLCWYMVWLHASSGQEWCLRTYVDENAAVKWCTNPVGCQYACEYPGVVTCLQPHGVWLRSGGCADS